MTEKDWKLYREERERALAEAHAARATCPDWFLPLVMWQVRWEYRLAARRRPGIPADAWEKKQ